MFYLAKDKVIGEYLKSLILQKYPSIRQFCIQYLEHADREGTDEEITKMSNRMSQILKGNKSIQIYDLPVFCDLLDVSCEQILSADKCYVPISGHITNYEIACSKKQEDWEAYIQRDDKLILCADEYNKTVIDYALEFRNYSFIRFLMDNGYIWFVEDCQPHYYEWRFGAGTSIEGRKIIYSDHDLSYHLMFEDKLRTRLAALAIENKGIEMLDMLHARETPALYRINHYSLPIFADQDKVEFEEFRNPYLIDAVAEADETVLDYFSTEFTIEDPAKHSYTFLFPYLGQVIDLMLENARPEAELLLRRVIKHNKCAFDNLHSILDEAVQCEYKATPHRK